MEKSPLLHRFITRHSDTMRRPRLRHEIAIASAEDPL
jgi:hypothetical protein